MSASGDLPRRVVIRAPNWLGDAVLALPAMVALRAHFAGAHLTVAARGSVAPLFREGTGVRQDALLVLPARGRDEIRALRGGAFDLGVLFPNSFGSAWVLRRAGVAGRWGWARAGRGLLLTRRSRVDGQPKYTHNADDYRTMVRGLGIVCGDEWPSVAASVESGEAGRSLLQRAGVAVGARVVGMAPGAAYGQAKQWSPVRWAEVTARLIRERDVTCALVGAAHDRPAAREIESWLRAHAPEALAHVVDFTGRTDLAGLVGLASLCQVFVAHDSGALHLSAALGRRMVGIFGSTDERMSYPLSEGEGVAAEAFCRPCHLRDCPIDHRCMKRVTVDMVYDAVSRQLAAGQEATA